MSCGLIGERAERLAHVGEESFWGSLKNEPVHHQRYARRDQATASIQGHIEIFYSRKGRHSRLGNPAPTRFAEQFSKRVEAA